MKDRIVILGAGESGTGSAVLALKHGFDVFVSDLGEIKEKYRNVLDSNNVKWEQGIHTEKEILTASEVIKSPGIKEDAPIIARVREKGSLPAGMQKERRYVSREATARPQ
jgi:UDP-N-acetylmuramoylalanine--D-glutamate ligase